MGVGAMFGRIKHWLFGKDKLCKECCLFCKFYEECKDDIEKGG